MSEDTLRQLFDKYLKGKISQDEIIQLQKYIADPRYTSVLDDILKEAYADRELSVSGDYDADAVFEEFIRKTAGRPGASGAQVRPLLKRLTAYAAAVVLIFFGAAVAYRYAGHDPVPQAVLPTKTPTVIPPGQDQAVLTLANGQQIVLDSTARGTLSNQAGTLVTGAKGRLIYQPGGGQSAGNNGSADDTQVAYNTITTARGGQYQLVLADGTRVWLNAASSLRFPTSFRGGQRQVTLTGEGYFQVARDASHPFIVSFDSTQVKVLGTAFNIMAYKDEAAARTTLVEGSIRVSRGASQATLEPGKTAVFKGDELRVEQADVDQVVAWKYGKLSFNHLDLKAIMRQVSRWYNVDVTYEGTVPDERFGGVISRNVNLSTVLEFLESNGIRCRQVANKITVLP